MSNLKEIIKKTEVPRNNIAIWWLAQAGFAIKTDRGKVIYIDPYLSDAVERLFGFKRLSLSPIKAEEVETDLVICTHGHADHLDPDAIPIIAKSLKTKFIGPKSCVQEFRKINIASERIIELAVGKTVEIKGGSITGMYADHGKLAPDAIGVLFNFGKIRVYYCGDTAYRPEHMGYVKSKKPDIIIPPINGQFGNLNEKEAVLLAKFVGARLIIPSHFWMFAEHNGNPARFMEIAKEESLPRRLLTPGETFIYPEDKSCGTI